MDTLKTLVDLFAALNTVTIVPVVSFIAWRIYRIETNHLPHIQKAINGLETAVARLQGRNDGVDAVREERE